MKTLHLYLFIQPITIPFKFIKQKHKEIRGKHRSRRLPLSYPITDKVCKIISWERTYIKYYDKFHALNSTQSKQIVNIFLRIIQHITFSSHNAIKLKTSDDTWKQSKTVTLKSKKNSNKNYRIFFKRWLKLHIQTYEL